MVKLNHKEEEVMRILWKLEKAFVADIIEEIPNPKPPYNTISSIVRKLEKMKVVGHEAFGKTYRYYPILKKEEYRKLSFRKMLQHYFGGSTEQLLSYFVKEEKVDPDEIKSLLEKLNEKS